MKLGSRSGVHADVHIRKTTCSIAVLPRLVAPPVFSSPLQPSRTTVIVQAKRGRKPGRKQQGDDAESNTGDATSAWDAALANIPTEDEAQSPSASQQVSRDGSRTSAYADESFLESDTTSQQLENAATADRTADQGPDPSQPAPSTSKSTTDAPEPPKKKLPSTVITLAEFQMLMEAKDIREQELAEQREREAREAAGGLAIQEPAPLVVGRQGFQVFPINGGEMEFLVSETADGRLGLADSYVAEKAAGGAPGQMRYSRPEFKGAIATEALHYQVIPWVERGDGDLFKRKEPTNNIKKLYFLPLRPSPGEGLEGAAVDLEGVAEFCGSARTLSLCEVRPVGTPPFTEPVLRIRPTGLTLEEAFLMADPYEVSDATAMDLADLSPEELEERLAELEAAAEELDELEEAPDVPSVDNM